MSLSEKGKTAILANHSRALTRRTRTEGTENPLALLSLGLKFPIEEPTINELHRIASRGIGKKLNEKLPDATWARPPKVTDGDDRSPFSQAWLTLVEEFPIWKALKDIDILLGYSHYACIYVNLSRGKDEENKDHIKWGNHDMSSLVSLDAYGEWGISLKPGISVISSGTDPKSERNCLPIEYNVQTYGVATGSTIGPIHWSRVIHFSSSPYAGSLGEPRLKSSYNTLLSIFKLYAAAEAIKKSGTKIVAEIADDAYLEEEDAAIMVESINRMNDDLSDAIISDKFNINTLVPQVPSPKDTWDMLRDMLAAESGIPAQQIFGTKQHQAQSQGSEDFSNIVKGRQITYAQDVILVPFIKRLIKIGVLPKTKGRLRIGSIDINGQMSWPTQKASSELQVAQTQKEKAIGVKMLVDSGIEVNKALEIMGLNA